MDADRSIVDTLAERVTFVHSAFLEGVADLDEETFHARPGAKAPSIAFHLWHTARWADAMQERLGSLAPALDRLAGREQAWSARGLAEAWGSAGRSAWKGRGWA